MVVPPPVGSRNRPNCSSSFFGKNSATKDKRENNENRHSKSWFGFWYTFQKKVLFLGPLIPLFWTSGDFCPEFQSHGGYPTYVLRCLHAMDSSDPPLVRHLLTSWRPVWQPRSLIHNRVSTTHSHFTANCCLNVQKCALEVCIVNFGINSHSTKINNKMSFHRFQCMGSEIDQFAIIYKMLGSHPDISAP